MCIPIIVLQFSKATGSINYVLKGNEGIRVSSIFLRVPQNSEKHMLIQALHSKQQQQQKINIWHFYSFSSKFMEYREFSAERSSFFLPFEEYKH